MVKLNRTQVEGTRRRDPSVYGLPSKANGEYLVPLHAVRGGMSEVEPALNYGNDGEVRKGLRDSRVEGPREILTQEGHGGEHAENHKCRICKCGLMARHQVFVIRGGDYD